MKTIIVSLFLLFLAGCGPVYHHNMLHRLNDQNDVIAAANRLFVCTDNRDWACVRDVFAPEVQFDMTSLGAPKAEKKTPQEIADMWEQGLKSLAAIHHQAGNFQAAIRENEADLSCYGIAYHYLPNPADRNTRTFVGSYHFHLVRADGDSAWKIDRFKFDLKFIEGNKELEEAAKKK